MNRLSPIVPATVLFFAGLCCGQSKQAEVTLKVAAGDALVGREQLANVAWPRPLLTELSSEGQFEMLVRKSAAGEIEAPHCKEAWLLVRMPGVLTTDPAFAKKVSVRRQAFAEYQRLTSQHRALEITVSSAGYGRPTSSGKLQLTGCNLWLKTP